ncbi:MAG: Stage sporulation protein [Firmicutes bacterium]|nr:Stage sporulation protein [Bacillota bacterium]
MSLNKVLEDRSIGLRKVLERYKWILLIIAVGLLFLAWPDGNSKVFPSAESGNCAFDLEEMEGKFSKALSEIEGAGRVTVVLTVKNGTQQILAEDTKYSERDNEVEEETSTVVLSRGSGVQEAVKLQEIYPQFQGALVICEGAGNPTVRLKLTEATTALTGLGADKISICSRGK